MRITIGIGICVSNVVVFPTSLHGLTHICLVIWCFFPHSTVLDKQEASHMKVIDNIQMPVGLQWTGFTKTSTGQTWAVGV